jgi:CheY-like chemotaxis protein
VDPGPTLRTIAQLHLAGTGFEIAEAPTVPAALAAVRRRTADLVVVALAPGLELLEALRQDADEGLRALPVVLTSPSPSAPSHARAEEFGARLLAAPVTGPRLAATVSDLLGIGRGVP